MTIILIPLFILSSIFFLYQWRRIRNKNSSPIPIWPLLGMVPTLMLNLHRVHDFAVDILLKSRRTFVFKGPIFSDLNFLVTSDPVNVNHILGRNFTNYEKGPGFREIFEFLGSGILNTDSDVWKSHRKLVNPLVNNNEFETLVMKIVKKKISRDLIPILDHGAENGVEVDLKDLIHRLVCDIIFSATVGSDPKSLSIELPKVEYITAMDEIEEALIYRHVVPMSVWKLQRWLQIGEERKMRRCVQIIDRYFDRCISSRFEKLQTMRHDDDDNHDDKDDEEGESFLTKLLSDDKISRTMLKDHAFSLIVAGHDSVSTSTTWFFWCVAKYPSVESSIADEIRAVFPDGAEKHEHEHILDRKRLDKMIYLHATILEVLRLYPPVPINHKTSMEADTLPTGHHVKPSTRVLISYYAMGRMKEIWGDDCLEFKPERWISSSAKGVKSLIHVPSHVFVAFNTGPRFCIGKETALIEMKMIAIMVIRKYNVGLVKDHHSGAVSSSVVLKRKNGLTVMISKKT